MGLIQLLIESKISDKIEKLIRKNKKLDVSDYEMQNWVIDTILKIDPTNNKKYVRGIIQKATDNSNLERLEQDGEKYRDGLETFHNNRKSGKLAENDIFKLNSGNELYKVVKPLLPIQPSEWKETINKLQKGKDYEIVEETSKFKLISVLSQQGASYLGGDTEWCTTYGEYCLNKEWQNRSSEFPDAIKDGEVYILGEKDTDRRWQFQFESDQFMNEEDHNVPKDLMEKIKSDEKIYSLFMDIAIKKVGKGVVRGKELIDNGFIDLKNMNSKQYEKLIANIIMYNSVDPLGSVLSLHYDWNEKYGEQPYKFFNDQKKVFKRLFDEDDFAEYLENRMKNYRIGANGILLMFNITSEANKTDNSLEKYGKFIKDVKQVSNNKEMKELAVEYNYIGKHDDIKGFIMIHNKVERNIVDIFANNMYEHFLEDDMEFDLLSVSTPSNNLYFITKR